MKMTVTQEGDIARFKIEEDIDERGAEIIKERFNEMNLSSLKEAVFDLSRVQHVGSSGIGKMLLFYKKLAVSGGSIRITNASPAVYDLLIALKLDSVFNISKGRSCMRIRYVCNFTRPPAANTSSFCGMRSRGRVT